MKLETQLLKIEDKLREAAEARNITPPVRQALRDAIDAVVTAQRELADTSYPLAVSHTEGRLYKADEHGNYHAMP
jgi:hypothetical protein